MIHGITCHVRPVLRRLKKRIISLTVHYVRALILMLIEGMIVLNFYLKNVKQRTMNLMVDKLYILNFYLMQV